MNRSDELRALWREIPALGEALILALAPGWATRRAAARKRYTRLYDAGSTHPQHRQPRSAQNSADAVMDAERGSLRGWGRYLDENYDLAIAVLDNLVTACLGTGLVFEPMVRTKGGQLHKPTNDALRRLWKEFYKHPEITRELSGPEMERLLCRSWLRDGEALIHHLEGNTRGLIHATPVPYSLELLEGDYLPFDTLSDMSNGNITHGVEKNLFGQPIAYHLYKNHPGNDPYTNLANVFDGSSTHRVTADVITHLKFVRRFRQTRGVTCLHGVIHRLDDLKDGDDSERIAHRIAAAFGAAITKSVDGIIDGDIDDAVEDRSFQMRPGMIWDKLRPGEDVKIIGSDRPNPNLVAFRSDQIRGVAGGTGAAYSPVSRHFDTSYAAQRAESVNNQPLEQALSGAFVRGGMVPVWERFARLCFASQLVPLRLSMVDVNTLADCDIRRGGGVPWVDPKADIGGDIELINSKLVSRQWVQRKRGIDPEQMDAEIEAYEAEHPEAAAPPNGGKPPNDGDDDDQDESNAA